MWMWLPLLLGCQEPFGTDRHDLVGTRIVAIQAGGGDRIQPSAALLEEGRMWADAPAALSWRWELPDSHPDTWRNEVVAEGSAPELMVPDRRRLLVLDAQFSVGERLQAMVVIPRQADPIEATAPEVDGLPLRVSRVKASELGVRRRGSLALEPTAGVVETGGFARIVSGADRPSQARFLSTAGTWFELDRHASDWAAGEVVVDDEEVVRRSVLDAGTVSMLVITLADDGSTAWQALDVHVGQPASGVWVDGRWLPTEGEFADEHVAGRLVADDTAPLGLALAEARGVGALGGADPYGTEALACEPAVSGPFDPRWVVTHRCARSALDGVEVVVRVDVAGP
jgi:hypothetical protein